MFPAVRTRYSPRLIETIIVAIFFLCSSLTSQTHAYPFTASGQSEQDLRFELPTNGNLRVENLRGGVIVEVWSENYVSVSALIENGEPGRSPATIQSSDRLLSIHVAPKGDAPPVNLRLKIPLRTHVAIMTHGDSVDVRGLPAALLVQTIAGEIRLDLSAQANASLVAESRTGKV